MTEQDKPRFASIMGGLSENFNGNLSGPGLDMRFAALSDFTIEQVNAAAMSCVRSRKYSNMPTIGELIEHIEGSKDDLKVEGEAQANEVLLAIRQKGVYATVKFADHVTNAVIKQFFGGWTQLCTRKADDHIWFIKDFAEHYADYKKRGIESAEPLRGIGSNEKAEMIGGPGHKAIEGNIDGREKVAALVGRIGCRIRG